MVRSSPGGRRRGPSKPSGRSHHHHLSSVECGRRLVAGFWLAVHVTVMSGAVVMTQTSTTREAVARRPWRRGRTRISRGVRWRSARCRLRRQRGRRMFLVGWSGGAGRRLTRALPLFPTNPLWECRITRASGVTRGACNSN
jgi:hypothetical protein